jgi:hypothetical protein
MVRFTYGVTKSNGLEPGYFTVTGEEIAPFYMKYHIETRKEQDEIRECALYVDDVDDIHPDHLTDYIKVRGRWWQVISCGCLHDTVVKAFPKLAPYVKWHLHYDGISIHYGANAVYHMECAHKYLMDAYDITRRGRFNAVVLADLDRYIKKFEMEVKRAHICMSRGSIDELALPPFFVESTDGLGRRSIGLDTESLRQYLTFRMPALRTAYRKDMETLKTLVL